MTSIVVTYSETETKARYAARVPDVDAEAEMTLSKASPTLIIVDHTFVPDDLRGQGLGIALAERVIADARQAGQRIIPLCPFLRAYGLKNKEALTDVMQL